MNRRLSITLTGDERREVLRRARLAGLSMAGFMRAAALTGSPLVPADTVETWWANLPAGRKQQVHRWLTAPGAGPAELDGQLGIDLEAS